MPKEQYKAYLNERHPYALAVGTLMYARLFTRLDIGYVIGMLINSGLDH